MKRKRYGGLGGTAKISYGREFGGRPVVKKATTNLSKAKLEQKERERISRVHNFSADALEILSHTDPALLNENDDGYIPGGEEGYFHSHEPGTESVLEPSVALTLEDFVPQWKDSRTRRDRVEKIHDEWEAQMDGMVGAYLSWERNGAPSLDAASSEQLWELRTISFQNYRLQTFWHEATSPHVAVTLVRHGFIGATASAPTLAIDVNLLRGFRQLHRVCPRLTVDAFAKALNHIHYVPHTPHLAQQLRNAYDCYLRLLRIVRQRKEVALRRSEKLCQQAITCPPCFYKTVDDPVLKPAFLAAIDGNNSLKLVDSAIRAGKERIDSRELHSRRWIEAEEVDVLKDEVANARKKSPQDDGSTYPQNSLDVDREMDSEVSEETDVAWLNVAETDGLEQTLNVCVDRWKNAGPESRKKMFSLFAYAGIFACVCRHGHLLLICDMIRSGELMKYPLAVVNRLLDDYGEDICLGYDIMCAFFTTLKHSSLSSKVVAMNLSGVVPAFHGHAHNRFCQLDWHPLYREGCGLEDFETSERTFNLSNHLAMSTRLSSVFHRRQDILEHFDFQDDDKHYASGTFIYNNYKQALDRISEEGEQLRALRNMFHPPLSASDLEGFVAEEREYLKGLKEMTSTPDHTTEYITLLTRAAELRVESDAAEERWKAYVADPSAYTSKQAASLTTRRRTTYERYHRKMDEVVDHEDAHGIATRWEPNSPEWEDGLRSLSEKRYLRAVDELERLLVQRMLEMTKLNISGTGYKQREQISKALKARSQAIRSAITRYNAAAELLDPPRPQLDWTEAVSMAASGEFDMLRGANTPSHVRWTDPRIREAINLHFRIKRAEEEIPRLNVEIVRLLTFMVDEDAIYRDAIANCKDDDLGSALEEDRQYREQIHSVIAGTLEATSRLPGFTGKLKISTAALPAFRRSPTEDSPLPLWARLLGLASTSSQTPEARETASGALANFEEMDPLDIAADSIVDYLENLSLYD